MIDMVTDAIVGSSMVAGLVFFAAWALRPDLRRRVEAPKHRFLDSLRRYDRLHADNPDGPR